MWFVVSSLNELRKVGYYIKWNELLKVEFVVISLPPPPLPTHSQHSPHSTLTSINMHSFTHWTVSSNSFQFYSLNFFAIAFKAILFMFRWKRTRFTVTQKTRFVIHLRERRRQTMKKKKKIERNGIWAVNIGPTHLVHRQRWRRPTQIKYLCAHMNVKWKKGKKHQREIENVAATEGIRE